MIKVEKYDQEHLRHMFRDWCEAEVSKYGVGSKYHEFRGCRRTAKFVVGSVKLCELHAGQKCLNYLLEKRDERNETGDGCQEKSQTRYSLLENGEEGSQRESCEAERKIAGGAGSETEVEEEMKSREMMLELLKKPEAEVFVKVGGRIRKVDSVEVCSNGFVFHPALPQPTVADSVIPEADTTMALDHEFRPLEGIHRIVVYEKGHTGIPSVHTVLEQSDVKDIDRQFGKFLNNIGFAVCPPGQKGALKFGVSYVKKIDGSVANWIKQRMEVCQWEPAMT
jgi:hypothetical protein